MMPSYETVCPACQNIEKKEERYEGIIAKIFTNVLFGIIITVIGVLGLWGMYHILKAIIGFIKYYEKFA